MERMVKWYKYITDKRFSTIAGTLVYFLLMSIVPFIMWLTLILGKIDIHIDIERFLSHELFESISPILRYLKSAAENAANSAGIILILTTLYSSTNFFYHLRRSGEIIYNSRRVKGGIKLRIASLLLILIIIILFGLLAAVVVIWNWLSNLFFTFYLADIAFCVFLALTAFTAALVLNIFVCPYKRKIKEILPGSLLTTALWLTALMGFSIYSKFSNPEQLYGRFAYIIIFLLWCYILMCCFVIGVIYNGFYCGKGEYKELL